MSSEAGPPPGRRGTSGLYAGFVLLGVVSVLLGPLVPELKRSWGLAEPQIAGLFLAQFAASSLGAVISTYSRRWSLVAGYALISGGLALLAGNAGWRGGPTPPGAWQMACSAVALAGLGIGLVIPATNLAVAHAHPHRRGAALSTVNLAWGGGAVGCQLLFAAIRGRASAVAVLWLLAPLAALVSALLAWKLEHDARGEHAAAASGARGRELGLSALLAGMLFLYVGVETAVGGWLVALTDQVRNGESAVSLLVNACFWGALLAGRAGAPLLLSRVAEPALYKTSLALALAGVLSILAVPAPAAMAAGALLAGFGLAPLFPLTVAFLSALTASTGSRGTGWVFAFAGLGGAALPWLTGQAAGRAGLAAGFLVPAAGLALLAALFSLYRASAGRASAGRTSAGRTSAGRTAA
jgi:fucose permease